MMTQADYARHRGCSAAYISKKVKDGTLTVEAGLIDSVKADATMSKSADPQKQYMAAVNAKQKGVAYQAEEDQDDSTPQAKYAVAKANRETELAKLAKLEFEERSGRVAPIALLEFALGEMCEQVKSILESIPLKVKNRCPELRAQAIEIIRTEIIKAQNAASRATIKLPGDA